MVIKELTERAALEESFNNKKGAVVFFYSGHCPIWEKRQQDIESIAQDFSGDIDFFKCNINETEMWQGFSIESSPSMVYFYKGKIYIIEHYIPEPEDIFIVLESIINDSAQEDIEFISKIKQATDSERSIADYYSYIANTTNNGNIKRLFSAMAEKAQRHAKKLQDFIEHFNGEIYRSKPEKIYRRVGEPESFSLLGAVKMALKLEKQSLAFYKRMAVLTDDETFKQLVKEEKEHKKILRKEMDFLKDKEILEEIDIQVEKQLLDDIFK